MLEIARHFLAEYAAEEGKNFKSIAPETEKIFSAYAWPGNVRQVQNVIRNVMVLHNGEVVTPDMLPPPLNKPDAAPAKTVRESAAMDSGAADDGSTATPGNSAEIVPLWRVEREVIERAIDACDGNIPKAASRLGISPSTIYRKKQNWEEEEANAGSS